MDTYSAVQTIVAEVTCGVVKGMLDAFLVDLAIVSVVLGRIIELGDDRLADTSFDVTDEESVGFLGTVVPLEEDSRVKVVESEFNFVACDAVVRVAVGSGVAGGKVRYPQFDTIEFDMVVDRSGKVVP